MLDSMPLRKNIPAGTVSTEVAQNRRMRLSTRIQSSLLVVDFRFGLILCSQFSKTCHENLFLKVTILFQYPKQRSVVNVPAQNRTDPKIGVFFSVNESPTRYVFGAGTRAIRYSVHSKRKKARNLNKAR